MIFYITPARAALCLLLTSASFQACGAENAEAPRVVRRLRGTSDASSVSVTDCTIELDEEIEMERECNRIVKSRGEMFGKCLWVKDRTTGKGSCSSFSTLRLTRPDEIDGLTEASCDAAHTHLCPVGRRCAEDLYWNRTAGRCDLVKECWTLRDSASCEAHTLLPCGWNANAAEPHKCEKACAKLSTKGRSACMDTYSCSWWSATMEISVPSESAGNTSSGGAPETTLNEGTCGIDLSAGALTRSSSNPADGPVDIVRIAVLGFCGILFSTFIVCAVLACIEWNRVKR
eukprot:GEMP01044026.1.p1 GENE.GEMP01044026.1~~GEMP01044026.1.p1  ORF type:complete len:288 (+),score=55.78 GEMP01044026.1:159-1022(+)